MPPRAQSKMPIPLQPTLEDLSTRWNELFDSLTKDSSSSTIHGHEDTRKTWFNRLVSRYSESQRAYHSLEHIAWLLSLMDSKDHSYNPIGSFGRDSCKEWAAVEAAIWFHDIVYDPKAKHGDNERESEGLWRTFADEIQMDLRLVEKVSEMILCTISHQLPESTDIDPDISLFLDMDLSILAAPEEIGKEGWAISYPDYAARIRKEYAHYPEEDYKKGRSVVLTRFLERPRLYFTDQALGKWEAKARENLRREILQLQG